jgi:hypothetical protein
VLGTDLETRVFLDIARHQVGHAVTNVPDQVPELMQILKRLSHSTTTMSMSTTQQMIPFGVKSLTCASAIVLCVEED